MGWSDQGETWARFWGMAHLGSQHPPNRSPMCAFVHGEVYTINYSTSMTFHCSHSALLLSQPIDVLQVGVGLQLPPVLGAALQLVSTLVVTTTNSTQCAAQYLQHQQVAARMHTLYSWLQPAIAPLEPLLWAAGIPAAHPFRRCCAGEGAGAVPSGHGSIHCCARHLLG